jgi:hypothetical protein
MAAVTLQVPRAGSVTLDARLCRENATMAHEGATSPTNWRRLTGGLRP